MAANLGRGCRVSVCSLGRGPWLSDSVARRVSAMAATLPGSVAGAGQEGALGRDSSKHQTRPLPAPSAEQGKTELSQQADVWCGISSLVLFCYFLKMSSGVSPGSAGLQEPRAALANAMPWEHLHLPALGSGSPEPLLYIEVVLIHDSPNYVVNVFLDDG